MEVIKELLIVGLNSLGTDKWVQEISIQYGRNTYSVQYHDYRQTEAYNSGFMVHVVYKFRSYVFLHPTLEGAKDNARSFLINV